MKFFLEGELVMDSWFREQVLQQVEERGVHFVRLQFTDLFGVLKNVAITVNQLEKALEGSLVFDGSALGDFFPAEENDLFLIPDPSTFVPFPWRPREGAVARLICSMKDAKGRPFEGCVRTVLRKAIREVMEKGYSMSVAPQAEFYLFTVDNTGRPTTVTHDRAGRFDLTPLDMGENARREMIIALQDMGFDIETSHHEVSPGQHEIDFKSDSVLSAADNIVTYKFVIRTIAQRHGLHATFMPKPLRDLGGSGLHLRMILFSGEKNAFYDPNEEDKRSDTLRYFIGGLLRHAPALSALANPTVNSFKRLNSDRAPKYITWSEVCGSSVVRVPFSSDECFVEWQSPDPACNPYLALAGVIKAGLDGIENKIEPPQPAETDPDLLSSRERERLGIRRLPETIAEALDALKNDPVINSTLGSYITDNFIKAKLLEWEDYKREVSQWEIDRYLTKF